MGRVNVAHFEAGTFAGQTARPKSRQAPLVGHFRQRVGLIHELRQLRRAEELAHRGGGRLGVDQIVRHDGVDIDGRHAFADRALHAQQADAVLVFHQFADRPHPAVAEVIDVVDFAAAVLQFVQGTHDFKDVLTTQDANRVLGLEAQTRVHLDAADGRQVVTFGIEEQPLEQGFGGIQRRRLTRAHDPVDVDQRFLAGRVLVHGKRVAHVRTDVDVVDRQGRNLGDLGFREGCQDFLGDFLTGLDIDLARFLVDEILGNVAADQVFRRHQDFLNLGGFQLGNGARGHLGADFKHDLAGLGVDQIAGQLLTLHAFGVQRRLPAVLDLLEHDLVVEVGQDVFG